MTGNPLVAQAHSSTTWYTGLGLVEDAEQVSSGIRHPPAVHRRRPGADRRLGSGSPATPTGPTRPSSWRSSVSAQFVTGKASVRRAGGRGGWVWCRAGLDNTIRVLSVVRGTPKDEAEDYRDILIEMADSSGDGVRLTQGYAATDAT